ncbi:maestro heat-like repeat-containing protein family member 2A [Liasis olivaceus]
MGNFIDAEMSQPSTNDSSLVDRASSVEEEAFKTTRSGPQQEQTIDILLRLACASCDDLLIAAVWSKLAVRVAAIELLGLVDSMIHEGILDLWLGRITQLLQYLTNAQIFKVHNEDEGLAYGLGICAMHHAEQVISILDEYQCYIDQLLTEHYLMESTESCYSITFDAIYEIIRNLIEWQMDEGNLNRIITALENWLLSPQSHERERATRALAQLLQIFKSHITSEVKQSIAHEGHLIGLLVPCCVHRQAALRYWGKAAIACLLNITFPSQIEISSTEFIKICDEEKQYHQSTIIFKTAMLIIKYLPPEELMSFIKTTLVGMLQDESWSEGVVDVLKIVLLHKADELHNRVEILLYTMYYILYSSDNIDVKKAVRGTIGTLVHVEPKKTVNTLLTFAWPDNWISMLSELEPEKTSSSMENSTGCSNTNEEVEKNEHQESMTNSHRHHGDLVNKKHQSSVYHSAHYFPHPSFHHQGQKYQNNQSEYCTPEHSSHLLVPSISFQHSSITEDNPLPEIRALWMSLAADYTVYPKVLDVLLDKVPTMDELRNETFFCLPNALSAVIWDFIALLEKEELLEGKEDSLFFYCLLSIPGVSTKLSMTSNNEWNRNCSPCSVAVQALQNMLKLAKSEFHILDTIEEDHGWDMMIDAQEQHKGFASLGRAIRNCIPGLFPRRVIPDLFPHLFSPKEAWRKDYAAFFAEFIGSPYVKKTETIFMKKIYMAMKHLLNDRNNVIKMYGMRGLCNAVHSLPRKVKKEKELILEFYLKSLTDPCYLNIRQEAMSGILKLLSHFSSIRTSTATVIAMQARSFFDENPLIRRSALEVFGQLSKFFYGRSNLFCEQMEKSLADLLIHLQDNDPEVVEVQHCPEKLNKKSAFMVATALRLNNYLTQQEKEENNT